MITRIQLIPTLCKYQMYLLCAWMSWQDDATAPKSSRVGSVPDEENSNGLMERDDGERRGAEVRPGAQAEDSKTQAEDPSDSQVSQGRQQRSKVTESKTSTSKVQKPRRTQCPYGSSCYRYCTARLRPEEPWMNFCFMNCTLKQANVQASLCIMA